MGATPQARRPRACEFLGWAVGDRCVDEPGGRSLPIARSRPSRYSTLALTPILPHIPTAPAAHTPAGRAAGRHGGGKANRHNTRSINACPVASAWAGTTTTARTTISRARVRWPMTPGGASARRAGSGACVSDGFFGRGGGWGWVRMVGVYQIKSIGLVSFHSHTPHICASSSQPHKQKAPPRLLAPAPDRGGGGAPPGGAQRCVLCGWMGGCVARPYRRTYIKNIYIHIPPVPTPSTKHYNIKCTASSASSPWPAWSSSPRLRGCS